MAPDAFRCVSFTALGLLAVITALPAGALPDTGLSGLTPTALLAASDPALASELAGKGWLVYSARSDNGTWDILQCRPDGRERRNLTDTADYEEAAPRFSPDGRQILFRRIEKGSIISHDKWGYQGQVVVCEFDGGKVRALGKSGEFPWVSWSPDGRQMASLVPKEIQIIDVETETVARTLPRNGIFQQLFWSPDGKWLTGVANLGGEVWTIVRVDAATGSVSPVHKFQNCTPDWFPDSFRIIFSSRPGNQKANNGYGWTQLWMANGDGTDARLVYGEEGFHIYGGAVSPDGKYVLFSKCVEDGGGSEKAGAPLFIMRLADAPMINGPSPEMRAAYPEAMPGPTLEVGMGWEPDWTFAEPGSE